MQMMTKIKLSSKNQVRFSIFKSPILITKPGYQTGHDNIMVNMCTKPPRLHQTFAMHSPPNNYRQLSETVTWTQSRTYAIRVTRTMDTKHRWYTKYSRFFNQHLAICWKLYDTCTAAVKL